MAFSSSKPRQISKTLVVVTTKYIITIIAYYRLVFVGASPTNCYWTRGLDGSAHTIGADGTTTNIALNSIFTLLIGHAIRSALKLLVFPRPTASSVGAIRTCTICIHSICALFINQTFESTRKFVRRKFVSALTVNTEGTAANTLNSALALPIGAAVRSALILGRPSFARPINTEGTTAIAENSTFTLPISAAVRSALILVIQLGAIGPFESGCLEIAYGVVFAVILSANKCDAGGKKAIVSTARRTIEWG